MRVPYVSPQALRLGTFSSIRASRGSALLCPWAMSQVSYDRPEMARAMDEAVRAEMMRVLEDELRPFVEAFRYDWPTDFARTDVHNAISQCATLQNFAMTLPTDDADRSAVEEWLLPAGARMYGEMTMRRYWAHASPLNLLTFVGLCLRSRYAAMAAWALAPLLCDYDRPHASTAHVLQAWHAYVDSHGRLCSQEFESILSRPLPNRCMALIDIAGWISHCRGSPSGCVDIAGWVLVWYLYRDYARHGPPMAAPYAVA